MIAASAIVLPLGFALLLSALLTAYWARSMTGRLANG